MIGAVVLAAGESRRMGVPKLLLLYGKSTIIETVLAGVAASRVDTTVVVLGAVRRALQAKIRGTDAAVAVNRRYREGMLSSVQTGIAALPPDCRAALIVLGDQPALPATVIDTLIGAWEAGRKGIILPVCGGRRGHPLLLDLKYRSEVLKLTQETGLRALLAAHPDDIQTVEVPEPGILADIDTPEDYRKALG